MGSLGTWGVVEVGCARLHRRSECVKAADSGGEGGSKREKAGGVWRDEKGLGERESGL